MSNRQGEFNHDRLKWLVIDCNIDAIFIENLNTVMDDNKKLCLANGDIIPLTPEMRIISEVTDVNNQAPATVSRMAQLHIQIEKSVDHPHLQRWIAGKSADKDFLTEQFKKYLQPAFISHWEDFKLHGFAQSIETFTQMWDGASKEITFDEGKKAHFFLYVFTWAFGGGLIDNVKQRYWFSDYVCQTSGFKCDNGKRIFDYYIPSGHNQKL